MSRQHSVPKSPLTELSDPRLVRQFSYIGGQWTGAATRETLAVTDPATGDWLGAVASLSAEESRAAVDAADAAFPVWSGLLPQDRSRLLRRWFELMGEHREDLARIMVLEQGKPISEARGEIDYAASFLEFYSEEAKRPNIEGVTSHLPDAEVEIWREPVGVAALITPWNFPAAMLTRKAGAALAAGCT
ncbi:MAG: aldehyde dehydrogenase family protein, partial [Paracoccaceae bacterium]